MLCLTRRVGEKLIVGDDITVTVISVDGQMARIGIAAPKSVRIDRCGGRERVDATEGAGSPEVSEV